MAALLHGALTTVIMIPAKRSPSSPTGTSVATPCEPAAEAKKPKTIPPETPLTEQHASPNVPSECAGSADERAVHTPACGVAAGVTIEAATTERLNVLHNRLSHWVHDFIDGVAADVGTKLSARFSTMQQKVLQNAIATDRLNAWSSHCSSALQSSEQHLLFGATSGARASGMFPPEAQPASSASSASVPEALLQTQAATDGEVPAVEGNGHDAQDESDADQVQTGRVEDDEHDDEEDEGVLVGALAGPCSQERGNVEVVKGQPRIVSPHSELPTPVQLSFGGPERKTP